MARLSEQAERLLVAMWAGAVIEADGMAPVVAQQHTNGHKLPVAQGHLRELLDRRLVVTYTGAGCRWVEVDDRMATEYLTALGAFGEA